MRLFACAKLFSLTHKVLVCSVICLAATLPAKAIDLEGIAYEVIDLLPLKPEEKGFAKFTVKSPECGGKLIESVLGDKIMVGMAAVFKAYKPGLKPFDIHNVAQCKMKMNPVNFAFSQAMGQSKGLISEMPEPFDEAVQAQADQSAAEFQEEANKEMMEAFPFTKHIDCACEAAFHEFSPGIENALGAIKTGNAKKIGEAVYELALEQSSLPIKPIRLIIEGDVKGAATSLVGQYGIPIGCKVAEFVIGVPSQVCEATAGYVGKGAKFVAGIGEDIYDELAGTAADPNQYYADNWRPWLSIAAANLVGEQGGWIQKGETGAKILPAIWKPCVKYYADHGDLLDELTFSDDDAARDICDPMRDQFAGGATGGDLAVIVATARQAARDYYLTGMRDAMYKFATPYAGNPNAVPGPSPKLFGSCIKGVDPLVSTLPARSEADRQALSDALCNELLLGPSNTVLQDLKAIAASITPIKSEIEKKKEEKKAEKEKKQAEQADREALQIAVMDAKGKCNVLAGAECTNMPTVIWNACEALLTRNEPLPLSKAKTCVNGFIPANIKVFNDLDPVLAKIMDRCNSLLPDEGNRKACLSKARTALYSCGKPTVQTAVGALKDLADGPPEVSGNKMFELIYNASAKLISAQMWHNNNECGSVEAYFSGLEARLAKKKALEDAAAAPLEAPGASFNDQNGIGGVLEIPDAIFPDQGDDEALAIAKARRDLVRLGCEEIETGTHRYRCFERAANNRCLGYKKRKHARDCTLADDAPKQAAQPTDEGNTNQQTQGGVLPERDLIALGCEELVPGSKQFRCHDRAANTRCIAYMKRKQVARCILRAGGDQQQAQEPAPQPDESGQQVLKQQGGEPSPQRDLIKLGCTDVRQDGREFECANMRAYGRCESYKSQGQIADCFIKQ